MDGREILKRYLEQRRELGESEFVLDNMSVDEALKALGASAAPSSAPAAGRRDAGSSSTAQPPAPVEAIVPNAARQAAEQAASSGDWREALRAVGAPKPESAPAKKDAVAANAAAAPAPSPPSAPSVVSASSDSGATSGDDQPPREKIPRLEMPSPVAGSVGHGMGVPGIVIGSPMRDLLPGPLSHLETLDAIAAAAASCTACGLYAGAKNAVPGEGSPAARFVCVGEAPGATEDELGRPFVGASGQLLTKILDAIKLAREDVFICNVLKHRPPGNRNPSQDEIKACSPFLLRQLEILQPRVILALGTFAAQTLLQTSTPIGKLRGQVHHYFGVPLIVTYHPAALLRNPSWKRPTWEDVQLARRIFDNAARDA